MQATTYLRSQFPSLISIAALAVLALTSSALAQVRPYIGYAYPAGGQQGTTFQIKLGGQNLDDINAVVVTGPGVKARLVEYHRRLNPQEMQLLGEQARALRRSTSAVASAMSMMKSEPAMMASGDTMMMSSAGAAKKAGAKTKNEAAAKMITMIEKRSREYVQLPACDSIASIALAEVTIAPDAEPGARELRIATTRGVSNPLAFHVGQFPEHTREPMMTAAKQILGKEALALRRRGTNEAESSVTLPCTLNGQIASGEVNRYRFAARKGQRLVLTTQARSLIPYIADAVPGWFQPVLALYDATGKEVAYDDDYRFLPDPTILYEVPRDGDYVLAIFDSIFRGREDFVYRITAGELPFITSLFPLGANAGSVVTPQMKGWNLQEAALTPPAKDAGPAVQRLVAKKKGLVSNRVPFAVDKLPETTEKEPNNTLATAQRVTLPVVINGRIDKPDDWDVFAFTANANDTLVAEVSARRLDSPLDSVLKLTDAAGKVIAFNDDHEDLSEGVNTHQADSYFMAKLPAAGTYYVHLGDTARKGGEEYAYRLRLSAPQPDFELRVVPSSLSLRTNSSGPITVYAQRKDGFKGPIKLELKNPPPGFSAQSVTVFPDQTTARITLKGTLTPSKGPIALSVIGTARMGEKEITHEAVPAEDRMQAFLWRHLVPASDFKVLVFDPGYEIPATRPLPKLPASLTNTVTVAKATIATNIVTGTNTVAGTNTLAAKPKFSKTQVSRRLRELKLLYEEGLLTPDFYCDKVAECETAQ